MAKKSTASPVLSLSRDAILDTLARFIAQRPGFELGNYSDYASYREESRQVTRQRHDAEKLLAAVRWRTSIDTPALVEAFRRSFSGRLSLSVSPKGEPMLDYCAGQYAPVEYRNAACAVLSSALWAYTREHAMPAPTKDAKGELVHDGLQPGNWLRLYFRREFGPRFAARHFN